MPPIVLNAIVLFLPAVSVAAAIAVYWRLRSRGARKLLAGLPIIAGTLVFVILGRSIGGLLNPVAEGPLGEVAAEALALHGKSVVVDLHADPLLFGRDLLERSDVGHVDIPRLLEGGTALQVFSLITRIPLGYNEVATDPDQLDMITLVALTHLWPPATYFSLHERSLYHARRLEDMARHSKGRLRLIRDRQDLEQLTAARARGEAVVGGLFSIEGAHVFGEDFDRELDALFGRGLRMMSLTHYFDNRFAGSVQGLEKGGLTLEGRELVSAFERRGIVVDLAHASHATIEDVLAIATRPLVFSHTGVAGTCDQYHNLRDEHIEAIASNGGVIGIGLWDTAVCGATARDTVRAMEHVIDLVGDRHVGLGSDFDGYVRAHFDTSRLPVLTQAMVDAGLEATTIRRILGGNAMRVLASVLPERSTAVGD
ncbi:MAG: peptidase M19 [bacterium]|nr:peptidase M19 [bacterium]MCP5042859.1 peptidase M19 [bacterium]